MGRNRLTLIPRSSLFLLALLPLLYLSVLYFYPLFNILKFSFIKEDSSFSFDLIFSFFTNSYYLKVLWFTFWQAALSTIFTLILALPGAYIFATYDFFGKNILKSIMTVPFVLPTVVVATAFHGLLKMEYSIFPIFLAHIFYNYSIILRIVGSYWANLQSDTSEAAKILGATDAQVFFKITLPLLKPAIFAASLLVFIFCFSSFGVILILGGPTFSTLEVAIYRQAVNFFNLPQAATLSLIQIVITFCLMWVYTKLQLKSSTLVDPEYRAKRKKNIKSKKTLGLISLNSIFIFVFLVTPLLSLIIKSFIGVEGNFSLSYYEALLANPEVSLFYVSPVNAIINSITIAFTCTILALIIGLCSAIFLTKSTSKFSNLLDPIFMLPLSTSAVTLGFGFIISLDQPPLNLRSSFILVPLAHTLVAFPFVVRTILPVMRSIPKHLTESAQLLGASSFKAWWRIEFPILFKPILVSAIFAFTVSIGEFGATMFIARPETPTIPLAIFRYFSQPGSLNYGQALSMSSILMLVTVTCFFMMERVQIRSTYGENKDVFS